MEPDIFSTTDQSGQQKPKGRLFSWHLRMLMMLGCIPIIYFINKLFFRYYFGRTSLMYADYEPQINPGLILIETIFLVIIIWMFRRRFQFSLRTLLIIVTLFAIACSWFAVKMKQARTQREAVEKIRKWGKEINITYSWQADPQTKPHIPEWLRQLAGDDFFYYVYGLEVRGTDLTSTDLLPLEELNQLQELSLFMSKIPDYKLAHLKELPQLRKLDLNGTNTTDAGLVYLKGMTKLDLLYLGYDSITDNGLEQLKGLSNLRTLDLEGTNITDAGLVHLKRLTQLNKLYLDETNITDEGLEKLKNLTKLEALNLDHTNITDAGLEKIKGLIKIHLLRLAKTKITDAGLVYLKELSQLEHLVISNNNITDAGLVHLKEMKQLHYLEIERTNVTDSGLKDLQKTLPGLNIFPYLNFDDDN
jgi:hypothetical protein